MLFTLFKKLETIFGLVIIVFAGIIAPIGFIIFCTWYLKMIGILIVIILWPELWKALKYKPRKPFWHNFK